MRNGHVLHICISKSVALAAKLVMDTYPETHAAGHRKLYNLINKLKQKMELHKKKISASDHFTRFKSFLDDSFHIPVSTPKKDSVHVLSVTDDKISDLISLHSDRDDSLHSAMPSPAPSTSYATPPCATLFEERPTIRQTLTTSTPRLQES